MKCKKCGNKTLLAKSWVDEFTADFEPYKNGKKEEPRIVESEFVICEICVIIDYCEKCEEVVSVCVEK